jgi:hypothetical protein
MFIRDNATGRVKRVNVEKVEVRDYRLLTKKRFFFPWREFRGKSDIYKLRMTGDEKILGVMALMRFPDEQRIEIKLLASSIENVGKEKLYEGIARCLIAYAGREAVKDYGEMACISLIPKTELKPHYIAEYGMKDAGWQIFMEGEALTDFIKRFI